MDSIIKLSTGKEIYANRELVSIKLGKENWELFNGYDSEIWLTEWDEKTDDYLPAYTKEELIELAELMINRWAYFINDVISGKVEVKK